MEVLTVIERIQPRLIRFRDSPDYVGMDRNRFNKEVRPYLTEIKIGIQGIAFDRHELDSWVDQYKEKFGRQRKKGVGSWDENAHQDLGTEAGSGILKNRSSDTKFTKALAQATSRRRN